MGFLSSVSDFASSAFGLAKDGISFLGSSGLLSAGSGALNSALSYGLNKKMAKYNSKLQKEQMEFQHQLNQKSLVESPDSVRRGLENAGYNPMLAVTQATNAPTVSGLGVGIPNGEYGIGDFGAAFDRASNSASQRKLQEKEREKIDKLTDAELEKLQAESKAALANSGAAMYDAQTRRLEASARIEKIKKETDSISPAARYGGDWIKDAKDIVAPALSGFGAYQGAKVASKMMAKAGIRDAVPYARAAASSAVVNSARSALLGVGSLLGPQSLIGYGGFKLSDYAIRHSGKARRISESPRWSHGNWSR